MTPAPLPEEHARRVLGDLVSEACQRFATEITEIVVQYLRTQGQLVRRESGGTVRRLRQAGRRGAQARP